MRVTEKLTPVAAAMSALATLACCLPLGVAGAVGCFEVARQRAHSPGRRPVQEA